jgi:hypothetical protein
MSIAINNLHGTVPASAVHEDLVALLFIARACSIVRIVRVANQASICSTRDDPCFCSSSFVLQRQHLWYTRDLVPLPLTIVILQPFTSCAANRDEHT